MTDGEERADPAVGSCWGMEQKFREILKTRALGSFVGVDSLRKMSLEFGIWQGWQTG